ncbi:hypothetical protein SU69_07395 [Thermosipho melanesiensis]|uniref:Uncharacterized protein n=2 Tax=Thermosipho melanesiensis TaxID=46541 RepID=A6LN03_THEM4|nr:DUF5309 family protein [Thermosipho melanesiensis]ABR31304.1 hypothetical protein Tmel_1457 [Thermosipho melanesiensis BI429]APT74379.1 hypothetical protein BW47_07725 [Thermosipho melanesiensis]OOC36326.1 hypothetical protein SU68_07465 [Thermosipho melanesiensis]OOC37144.1 hypothetical protein SU69_07395 [Thermosipho melanesiensis]OOC37896.1 hypothetical protein SU70_07405 [Thermosipho melanesiensis]
MGTINGMVTTYDVAENKIDVSPVLSMLKLPNTPLLNAIGISNETVDSTRYEWWDDVLPVLKVKLAAAYTAGGGSLTVETGAGKKFKVGNVIKVENSIYRVTAINGDVLSVAVVSGDADHAANVDVELIGDAQPEGQDYNDSNYEQKVKRYNVTQIFSDYVKFSGSQLAVKQYVNEDVFLNEVQRKLKKLKILLERTAWLGIRVDPNDNSGPRMMGGIKYFIDSDGITSTNTWSEDNFRAFLKLIYDNGGYITEAWMNASTKQYFNSLNSDKLIVTQDERTAGRLVDGYLSEYGQISLKTSPHIPEGMIIVVDTSNLKIKPLSGRNMAYEPLAKTGDSVKGQIVGEYTLEFRNPDGAGIFYIQ